MSSGHLKKLTTVSPAKIEWRDGLPYCAEFEDVYFSVHGAIQESQHVFVEGNNLMHDWSSSSQNHFNLIELGFGSGLNFLNTAHNWRRFLGTKKTAKTTKHLHYIAIEKRPFSLHDFSQACACWPEFNAISKQLIDDYPSTTYGRHQIYFDENNITLTLFYMPVKEALHDLITESKAQQAKIEIDHWFLDGFAPAKNGSMWDQENAYNIAKLSKDGTRLASYSVAASVKRPLLEAGFKITKKPGFAKKREMLTALFCVQKPGKDEAKYINIKHETPWFNICKSSSVSSSKQNKVAIIGAGIAGCMTAHALDAKGITCDIFDSNSDLAKGASGAAAGIFHPQLTLDMNYGSQFSWLAYLRLVRFLADLKADLNPEQNAKIILKQGLCRILENKSQLTSLMDLSVRLNLDRWLKLAELNDGMNAIYFPHAAALDIPELCHYIYEKICCKGTNFYPNSRIDFVDFKNSKYHLSVNHQTKEYTNVISCVGARSNLLTQLKIENTNTTRGQTCFFESKPLAKELSTILSDQIYLIPGHDHRFLLGATFENSPSPKSSSVHENPEHDQLSLSSQTSLLNSAAKLLTKHRYPSLTTEQIKSTPLAGNLGYRLHSHDRLPQVGAHLDHLKLARDFAHVGQKRLKRSNIGTYNLPGLWVNTGYGSHGLLHSLLASEHLVSQITNGISPISQELSNSLNPARFLVRKLKKGTYLI